VSPLVVTDRIIGLKELKVKQQHQPAAISIWPTTMCVGG
jgi:hypothetical protein